MWDRESRTQRVVSLDHTGYFAVGASDLPAMTPDAATIVFTSNQPNVPYDNNGLTDILVRHDATASTLAASVSASGAFGNAGTYSVPSVSANGRLVVFSSQATNLVPGDSNGREDIFVRELDDPAIGWLAALNDARKASGLPAVGQNADWCNGAVAHSAYMVRTDHQGHSEDEASPHYTAAGHEAAQNGNVMATSSVTAGFQTAFTSWLQGPFHAVGMLDPQLATSVYGDFREDGATYRMGATLDVLRGQLPSVPGDVIFPVVWPGAGSVVPLHLRQYTGGESPNPLSPCSGYSGYTGLPLIAQFGSGAGTPVVTGSSLHDDTYDVTLEHCVYGETSYTNSSATDQAVGRGVLASRDAVVMVPKLPLGEGRAYTASLTVDGVPRTWSFSIATTSLCNLLPQAVALDVPPEGGTYNVDVKAIEGCSWTASEGYDWITVTEGATGTGPRRVGFVVGPHTGATTRYGAVSLSSRSISITQLGTGSSCQFSLSSNSLQTGSEAGTADVTVTVTGDCPTWTAWTADSWLTVTGSSYWGTARPQFSFKANTSASVRVGTVTIAGKPFTVTQAPGACSFDLSPGALAVPAAGATGNLSVNASSLGCAWSAASSDAWLTVSPASGSASGVVSFVAGANTGASARQALVTVAGRTATITQGSAGDPDGAPFAPGSSNLLLLGTSAGNALIRLEGVTAGGTLRATCQHTGLGMPRDTARFATDHAFELQVSQGASFESAEVCLPYDETEILQAGLTPRVLRLWHRETGGAWMDVTARVDGVARLVCGTVTHFSDFTIGGPAIIPAYLAEGATGALFDMRLAFVNPTLKDTHATVRFLRAKGDPMEHTLQVPAMTRATLWPELLAGLENAEFSTTVESDVPLVVDRSMSWDGRGYGSHAETAVPSPALTWYLAEGATHSGFDLFYLLQNPHPTDTAIVRVRYLRTSGPPLEKTYPIAPQSRQNIWVNQEQFPEGSGVLALGSADFSAALEVVSGPPIIVERAMYRGEPGRTFAAGHNSAGVTSPGTRWFLAEGATGTFFDLFVLIANPSSGPAELKVTYLLTDGTTIVRRYGGTGSTAPALAANSRMTIWVDLEDARLANASMSTIVESTNGVGIIVERAMWWPGPTAATWTEAHNSPATTETGTKWALAEGEVGGTTSQDTYILIANTAAHAGTARVTLLFEDGATSTADVGLLPNSRTTVHVGSHFPGAVGKRFGALVESTGAVPVPIVVERAMYSSDGGAATFSPYWPAGTNAVATKVQ